METNRDLNGLLLNADDRLLSAYLDFAPARDQQRQLLQLRANRDVARGVRLPLLGFLQQELEPLHDLHQRRCGDGDIRYQTKRIIRREK